MAAGRTSFVKTRRIHGFTSLLTSAACEWFLIFLLLVDAVLSCLLTKFASYCQLQAPCLLCSRLDRVLGGKNKDFYQYLLCSSHRLEISSLVSCHIHGKVADGHGMCDDCLLSVTTKTEPNPKIQSLLVGKLGLVLSGCGFQPPLLSKELFTGSKGLRTCTCCGKPWKSGQNTPRSVQLKSPGTAVLKPYIPLPHLPRQSLLKHWDKVMDKFSGSVPSHCPGKSSCDPLPPVGYTELKLTSDTGSDFPFSDDDDEGSVFRENIEASDDPIAQFTSVIPPKSLPIDLNPANPNSNSPNPMPLLLLDPCMKPDIIKHREVKFPDSDAVNDLGLGEINWQQMNQKSSMPNLPDFISLDEVSPSPNVVNISEENKKINSLSRNSLLTPSSELMTLDGTHAFVGASPEKSVDVTGATSIGLVSKKPEEELEYTSTWARASIETELIVNDSAPRASSLRLGNSGSMSKFPVTTKETEIPGYVIEQSSTEEVDRVKEELELLASHISSPRGSNISSFVPINLVHYPEIQAEASISNGTQELQKSASVESDLESLDGSNICGIEGESTVDRLKRQIEYDKKCINALYKELEEERNAAAIAANQAMAMITRLQEEKAALHMEALQYLRMMEEQAEYDGDALDKVNDLLAEKEKEIQDLEAEIEWYKENLTDELMAHGMHKEICDLKADNITVQNVGVIHITNTVKISSDAKITEVSKVNDEAVAGETCSLEFEVEKLYISQYLKSLEKKLHQIYYNGISRNMPNGRPEKLEDSKPNQQGHSNGEGPQLDGQIEETDFSIQKNITMNGSLTDQDDLVASDSDDCSRSKENNHSTYVGPKSSMPRRKVDLVALENAMSDLNDRLEALEADHDLLEHILNYLQNGSNGLQFIQDIAHQLHELRKIGIKLSDVCKIRMQNQKKLF